MNRLLIAALAGLAMITSAYAEEPVTNVAKCYATVPVEEMHRMVHESVEQVGVKTTGTMSEEILMALRYRIGRYFNHTGDERDQADRRVPPFARTSVLQQGIAMIVECFPEVRAAKAKYQEAVAAAKLPQNRLFRAYKLYAEVQFCSQVRQGYALVWVNDVELERAHIAAKAVEKAAVAEQSDLNTTDLWQQAVRSMKAENWMANSWNCQQALEMLVHMSPVGVYTYQKP
jgi:hypothetical protein